MLLLISLNEMQPKPSSRALSDVSFKLRLSYRGIPEGSRSLLDMSVIVCRASTGTSNPRPLSLVFHSKRQVKSNVSCNAILEEGTYMISMYTKCSSV